MTPEDALPVSVRPATIKLADAVFQPDFSGALWWEACRTLIVADLHLEKGAAYARLGALLPPYDTRTTLRRLSEVIDRFGAERIILLGDSFHDRHGMEQLPDMERTMLEALQARCAWHWVTGNHDPDISDRLGGAVSDGFRECDLVFRHEPSVAPVQGEIAGHLHPAARIVRHGRSLRRRCFIENGRRMILPAFGAYTGGLNVCDGAFDAVFRSQGERAATRVWMTGAAAVFGVPERDLRPD